LFFNQEEGGIVQQTQAKDSSTKPKERDENKPLRFTGNFYDCIKKNGTLINEADSSKFDRAVGIKA